jgi:hypothetical protein
VVDGKKRTTLVRVNWEWKIPVVARSRLRACPTTGTSKKEESHNRNSPDWSVGNRCEPEG